MEKQNKLKENHYVIVANRIKEELKDSFLFDYFKIHFDRLDKLVKEPLRLGIFGEFSSGKTSFINRLLNLSLPTKRVPTTKVITLIKYGDKEKFEIEYKDKNSDIDKYSIREYETLNKLNEILETESDLIEIKEIRIYINNPILKTFEIIDTPGFNDGEFEEITKTLFDKVNFAIWIFSAIQAGKETEKNILEEFKNKSIYKNNIYAFINQADIVEEKDIKDIQDSLQTHQEYFMNKNILAISATKKDENWNKKFDDLIDDLKLKVLNKDIEISKEQIQDEFKKIKQKLENLKLNFFNINDSSNNSFEEFISSYPPNYKRKQQTQENIIKQIHKDVTTIKEEVISNEIYEDKLLEKGIEFLAFYKTMDNLDNIDKNLKQIYIQYVKEFKKDFDTQRKKLLDLLNELIIKDTKFCEHIYKKFEKISFILDTIKETKQLLIVGYIIGILTDGFIYKHKNKKDIFNELNQDVIMNLINLDLDIRYFIEEIKNIQDEINKFLLSQIQLLDNNIEKE